MSGIYGELKGELDKKIKIHMDNQPYSVKCKECKQELIYQCEVDDDCDMFIIIDKCDCSEERNE